MTMAVLEEKAVALSNVRDLKQERQRRAARRMALQALVLQRSYPYVFGFIGYKSLPVTPCRT